ncbi:unnamed protein product [Peniophora sp. CBMAI 1063]|nr:unnamed protein product [Peniophora sp. CBMAI 1063]
MAALANNANHGAHHAPPQTYEERLANAVWAGERYNLRKQGNIRESVNPLTWGRLDPFMAIGDSYNRFEFSLAKTRYTMGRAADNDIVLQNKLISRHHLTIEYHPEKRVVTVTDHSTRGTWVYKPPTRSYDGLLERGVPYPLTDGDYLEVGYHTYVFHSHVGQLVERPSTRDYLEYESMLLRVLPAVQDHIRNVICSHKHIEPQNCNSNDIHTNASLLNEKDARKMLAIHLMLGHLAPENGPVYPDIPVPRNDNNRDRSPSPTPEKRNKSTPPPTPSHPRRETPPPSRSSKKQREEWPTWALFGRKDSEGRLPPMVGYSPGPTPWDIAERIRKSKLAPAPEAGPSRKRSRDSEDSNVSDSSDDERPAQRRRSPAPPPETPAAPRRALRRGKRTPSMYNVVDAEAGPSMRLPAHMRNIRKRSHDESEEDEDSSSAGVKAELSSPSPSPAPASKRRRTQKTNPRSEPEIKREPRTRARTQPQAQPTRRSQRIAGQPDEARAPARAAPLGPVAAVKKAAQGKKKAAGSAGGRRRR